MKTTRVLQALSLLLILIIAVSCRNSRSTTGRQYPRNPTPPTETPTKTYPLIVNRTSLPPGQAKKVYGSQSAKPYAPGQTKKYANRHPLVIVHTSGIVISQHSDGRYYYRNTAGYTYWKGYDGRYYLDEKHLKGLVYDASEYDDWKFKGQKNNNAQVTKGKAQDENAKEDQKTKAIKNTANDKEQKGKGQSQKAKDNDQKGKDQIEQKGKDDNPSKGKSKAKDKG